MSHRPDFHPAAQTAIALLTLILTAIGVAVAILTFIWMVAPHLLL